MLKHDGKEEGNANSEEGSWCSLVQSKYKF